MPDFDPSRPLKQEQHEAFCLEYLANGFNLTRAYSAVYPDITLDSARSTVHKLIAIPSVKARMEYLAKEMLDATHEVTKLRLQALWKGIAFARPLDYFDAENNCWDLKRLVEDSPPWVKKIKYKMLKQMDQGEDKPPVGVYDVEIEFIGPERSAEVLGKISGILTDAPIAVQANLQLDEKSERAIDALLKRLDSGGEPGGSEG